MDDLDKQIRHNDEDRWLASRFAPADVRARLVAIYALNHEIARTAETVSQAAIGDIRLAWWREALAEIASGKPPRAHPILQAIFARDAAAPAWERLIAARGRDLDAQPFATWAELEDYLDATAGGVMRVAIAICGVDPGTQEPFVRAAAQAWGCVGLLRAETHWRAKGRTLLPLEGGTLDDLAERARRASGDKRALSAKLPAAAFPAGGYVALASSYLRAHAHGREATPLLLRQLRLIAASATGRL
jgi:phytoene synthase